MADDHVVTVGEIEHPFKELFIRYGSGWIVRIVDPQKLGLLCDIRWNRIEVREKTILFL